MSLASDQKLTMHSSVRNCDAT